MAYKPLRRGPFVVVALICGLLVASMGVGTAQTTVWTPLDEFGADGADDGEFSQPIGLTVDSDGNIWTAENGGGETRRVQKFGPHGDHRDTIDTFRDGEFVIPHAIDADDKGNVWVADAGNGRLLQLDEDGKRTGRSFAQFGIRDDSFSEGCPCGVAVAPEQNLLYGSNGPDRRILVFNTRTDKFVRDFVTAGQTAGHLATDSAGNVLVADPETSTIRKYNKKGRLLDTISMIGSSTGPRPFAGMSGIDTDADDRIYVMQGQSIVVLESDGNEVAASEFDGGTPAFEHGQDITTDGFGNVYTLEGVPNEPSRVRRLMFGPALPSCRGRTATLLGTLGNDRGDNRLVGTSADDVIVGLDGNDVIKAGSGDDRACGGAGNDKLSGGNGKDKLKAGSGDDKLFGGKGEDKLLGGTGDDKLTGGGADDTLNGGKGDDVLKGKGGDDLLKGKSGADVLKGGDDDDNLFGGTGNDRLNGGDGTDLASGGKGNDTCTNAETTRSC